jgi:hypothetical protein
MPDQNTSAREWKPGDFIVIASHSGHVGETGVVAEAHGSYVNAVIPAMGGGQSMSVVDAGGKCAVRNRGRGRGEVDWVVDGFWSTWASLPRPLTVLSPGYLGEEA